MDNNYKSKIVLGGHSAVIPTVVLSYIKWDIITETVAFKWLVSLSPSVFLPFGCCVTSAEKNYSEQKLKQLWSLCEDLAAVYRPSWEKVTEPHSIVSAYQKK